MPLSSLFGRPLVERHEHFDADGLFTGATVVHRPSEFTREDVAALLAWRRKRADLGGHGFPMSEATDKANQGMFEGYLITDYVERARQMARAKLKREYPDDPGYGHIWGVRRRT